ncbi:MULTISPECIES: ABC transporter substrate-binding protein [unclassified Campylobacter]|uniref:ABC transporter substrate-binding protein n=1 Tax=unclassified Campylobacter TaxID=2593542 RepID=UPI001BD9860E|nr:MULTISPECIES: ABC transporter substrate-binding protein [unclassified Campylobacter]MBZ7976800.1 ABC transporter substrate-binding protein [Campylobacter sp. RM12637]MBZ7978452.1 ABC transporter substrate-binding protein [Campylobacter sp. RM12654]MBZ7984193.1 ABC transporter substrate-binding protein [Campylobacter sp. RM12647]MBZ7991805.1 ABC transporter substrate-binding protein [Campylobacter sp. RM9331]MBZ8006085.1 ABC transporter substrate-binding protein [Campylobacter sp. RM9332]
MFKGLLKSLVVASVLCVGANAKVEVIKDVLDREVKVDLPAKRIVLGFYYTDFLAVGGKDALKNVVGFSKEVWTGWTPASWDAYIKVLPELNNIADVGEVELSTFSVEKVLSLKPDLLVLADWQYEMIKDQLEPINKANIPIVILDYNRESVERHIRSTEVIGKITNNEARANELISFYKGIIDDVQERIKKANLKKPKIYIEFGNLGPKEHSYTFGKDMWGALIDLAGGDNIAAPLVEKWMPIHPEEVLASKPDVIIIAGRETELKKNPEAMVMGIGINEEEANKRLNGFKTRAGWDSLPAIKDNRLFAVYQGASRTLVDASMVQFIAKALYPDLFKDIDPIKTYIDYHKKYLPIIPTGSFGIQAK